MKRFTAVLLLLCLAAALCSCATFSGPSGVANRFMANLKAYDLEGAGKCLLNPDELDADKSESNVFYDYYKDCAKKMKFKIVESTEDGDKGTVKVHVTYLDSGELFAEVYKEYLAKSLTSALSGKKNENLLGDIFDEKKPDFPPKTAETDLIFNCTKKDGRWYIDKMPDGCTRVMTSGMTGLLGDLISSFWK
jgi:hypothetical protein